MIATWLIAAIVEIFTSIYLLYKRIKLKTVALLLLSISLMLFSGGSIFIILTNLYPGNPVFDILGLYTGILGLFIFIIYCSYVETESITSTKAFLALGIFSVTSTILAFNFQKYQQVNLSSGVIMFLFWDPTVYLAIFVCAVYANLVFLSTFIPFLKKAEKTRHARFLIINILTGALTTFGASLNSLYMSLIIISNTANIAVEIIFFLKFLMLLYPLSVLMSAIFDINVLWAPAFSLEALYVFHSSGITVFSFNFLKRKDTNNILITNILSALMISIREITATSGIINRISLEDKVVYLDKKGDLNFALFCAKPSKSLYMAFQRFVNDFAKICAPEIIVRNEKTLFVKNASRGYDIVAKVFPVF